ncbi:hypothetical protein SS1G_03293 [Sclerotinia sclerotiorum 1980 UF-70]|uniref:Glycosyl transferase CAP10 domain-containing protein n=1 Tax=Sclerotinia sclerotiorum (strain ATCC 18683 / 1980 / Ss-1) TaxID=665079 RepID=A7EDA3_SCLS1|nr:hypothetical protein SS1G_03293 [Sclerotinia sclerotiorum 1980 UF-70]EDO00819.1 hypothetical protein SS1G_03293 [Sclerotinia sclerotiorum 1980 UF-70]
MAIFNDITMATARRPYTFILALLLTLLFFLYTSRVEKFSAAPPRIYTPTANEEMQLDSEYISGRFGFDGTWNYTRDYRNLFLSQKQCDVAFPGLFEEVERPVRLRRNKKISRKELDDTPALNGFIRAMIFDQQLYVIDTSGKIYSRGLATLQALHRAMLTSPEPLPNIEFTMNVDDKMEGHPQWLYARQAHQSETWLMPEYGFWSWPETKIGSYGEMQMKALMTEASWPWDRKIDKLLWRGATMNLEVRKKFIEMTQGKEWADVKSLDWHDEGSMKNDLKSMDEHLQDQQERKICSFLKRFQEIYKVKLYDKERKNSSVFEASSVVWDTFTLFSRADIQGTTPYTTWGWIGGCGVCRLE